MGQGLGAGAEGCLLPLPPSLPRVETLSMKLTASFLRLLTSLGFFPENEQIYQYLQA